MSLNSNESTLLLLRIKRLKFFHKKKTKMVHKKMLATLAVALSLTTLVKAEGNYLKGDFHQHTTYSDGSYSFAHMMAKNNQYGLDWWANNDHGGGFNRDGRVSGSDLNTTVYWDSYSANAILGSTSSSGGHQNMWRWQSLRDYSFVDVLTARLLYPSKTIIQGYEWNVPGHEHASFAVISNQFDAAPNCNPLAEFEFKFDNSDNDVTGGVAQGWTKSTATDHAKTLEAITWLQTNYKTTSYVVPAHPERQKKYKINDFRDMNNAGPDVCFGFESMPGHQKSSGRGGYSANSDGGVTYGGCGVYAAEIGGMWDAMLSEGRNFWLFANSDSHSESGDFYPGEYQKNYTYTTGKSAQNIVDGLRAGNTWVVEGDLIDSLVYNIETVDTEKTTGVMGADMLITKGKTIKITIKARDPQGNNFNTYSAYTNPELNHIDLIKGKITGMVDPSSADYSVASVNTTSVIARFDANGGVADSKNIVSKQWKSLGNGWVEMSMIIPNVTDSVYFRLRGTNQGLNVENETDAAGNPLTDALMGDNNAEKAFADLWFYSNPIFVYTTATVTKAFQIMSGDDDLEECIAPINGQTQTEPIGSVDPGSSDIELGSENTDNSIPQLAGLRFSGVQLNKNAVVKNAYIQFEVDETKASDPCNLFIYTEDNDNPLTFVSENNSLSSRTLLKDSITWNIDSSEGKVVNAKLNSPALTSLVQATVNRSGWAAGNAMAFYVKGLGTRTVESYDGEPSAAATLFVEYDMTNQDILDMQIADSIAVKHKQISDSILAKVSELNEIDYTIPTWTSLKRAITSTTASSDFASIVALEEAIDGLKSKEMPYTVSMAINGNPTSQLGFTWYTNLGIDKGEVQIVQGKVSAIADFETASKTVFAADTLNIHNLNYTNSRNNLSSLAGIADNSKRDYSSHKALVSGLTANTSYSYRVGKNGSWSEIGTFTTAKANKDDFSFFYIADTQAMNDDYFSVSQRTVKTAAETVPNAQFCLMTGDLVESSGSSNSEWEWERWFELMQPVWKNMPIAPVCGNHDKSTNKNLTNHFNTAKVDFDQKMSTTPGTVYSFVYGDALFIACSTEDYGVPGYLDSLQNYVRREVAAHPEVKWKIAFYHKTVYTGSQSHQSDSDGKTVREALVPVFDEVGIDLAFQGHDHIYEVIGVTNNFSMVDGAVNGVETVSAGGDRENMTGKSGGVYNVQNGTLFFLNNSAGKKKYEPRTEAQMNDAFNRTGVTNYWGMFTGKFGQTGEPTFSDVKISTDTIFVTTYTVDPAGVATKYDAFKVVKSTDTTTKLDNSQQSMNIRIYPNPSNSVVNVDGVKADFIGLYDLKGQLVTSVKGLNRIDVSSLNEGAYLIKVLSADKMFVDKIVVD